MEHIIKDVRIFVVFSMDSLQNRWWQKYLRKPFWHCLVIYTWFDGIDHWAYVGDPVIDFKKRNVFFREDKPFKISHWFTYMLTYREIHIKNTKMSPKIVNMNICLDNYKSMFILQQKIPLCTTLVKRVLGICSWAITPKQLYKVLKRRGGKELFVI